MSNIFNWVYDTFSQTNTEKWKQIAKKINGRFINASALKGQKIETEYKGIRIMYDIVTISRTTVDTRVRIQFPSSVLYHLVLGTKKWPNFYMNVLGAKTASELMRYKKIKLDEELSQLFTIKGTDEDLNAELFDKRMVKVLNSSDIHTFQIHCNRQSGKILSMIYGSINDETYFLKFHEMVCTLIDHMKTLGMID